MIDSLIPKMVVHGFHLLADGRINDLGYHFQNSSSRSSIAYYALLMVPIIAAIAGYSVYQFNNRPKYVINTGEGLLRELCRAHRIRGGHLLLLMAIAETAEVSPPGLLFTAPGLFDEAVKKASEQIQFSIAEREAIGQLKRQIFESDKVKR
ncbi:hypothetical protein FF011L_31130 [Roseimaritima multifibrata]|uniref:Uncharacterized protein n=1 Tax=Roseimaritima multifibrata TaxID=1930274 RepID=A0A517MHH5_9BACT|nr:hypothetical protein [Roseimaritima multifibrata]QDS94334.1 hypothetical protein FF011L_31130 [Roseimaritima multifibrata]